MKKKNGVNHSMQIATKSRRKSVIERLELQLQSKVKNTKNGVEKLTVQDIARINKELEILKVRV
jgi:hypothetical protein